MPKWNEVALITTMTLPSATTTAVAALVGTTLLLAAATAVHHHQRCRKQQRDKVTHLLSSYEALIGNTPLVKMNKLSSMLRRGIYVKMESLNPGGTGKDRAALGMIRAAEASGALPAAAPPGSTTMTKATTTAAKSAQPCSAPVPSTSMSTSAAATKTAGGESIEDALIRQAMSHSRTGGLVVEGTSGSTGISLATLSRVRGHACLVVLPDDQAAEKQTILRTLGAVVHVVRNVAYSNPAHYVNVARRIAAKARTEYGIRAVFVDQFENEANYRTHYTHTGPEIWRQCPDLAAFVMSSGTGGTIAGVGHFLKQQKQKQQQNSCSPSSPSSSCRIVLVDPPGSALYHKIQHGVAYAPQQREQGLKRHRYDTLAEGIGLDRVTNNLCLGLPYIDEAVQVGDQEAVDMAHWLLGTEGLWVGSSSAMNVVGAVRTALSLPEGSKVVTVVCDAGHRHVTRFWNRDFCLSRDLTWPGDDNNDVDSSPEEEQRRLPECLRSCFVNGGSRTKE